MDRTPSIRTGWLKLLYVYTLLGAGGTGLLILFTPQSFMQFFSMPATEPYFFGAVGSVFLAFAVVAALGLRSPLTFAPMLLVQLLYKIAWFAFVFIPRLLQGSIPFYGWFVAAVFLSYIILDVIAIPFRWVFSNKAAVTGWVTG